MSDQKVIRAVTEAKLSLELVDGEVFEQLKARKHTYVGTRGLRSSNELLISEGFARCQGVSFLNGSGDIGALAHNYSTHDPYDSLTGAWTGGEYHLEDPRVIFGDVSKVIAVHMYHKQSYEWPESWIEGALGKIGIGKVVHIPIKSKKAGRVFWRHMALDVKEGSVYVFPTDFDVGIKYSPESLTGL